ncbi:MAG TPA: hypothetical protein VGO64_10975 [Candidatus Limnocylindrales bacterium]|nr:hypothetical protein [Candidatus Limnocylindrales bacterium]
MSLQLHRPDGKGGIEPRSVREPNWRRQLQSSRWGMNRRDGRMPALENPEMNPTPTWLAVAFWVGLAALTFAVLVVGYGSGFWHLPVVPGVPGASPIPSVVPSAAV